MGLLIIYTSYFIFRQSKEDRRKSGETTANYDQKILSNTFLGDAFSEMTDPRRNLKGNFSYPMEEIMLLVIAAVIASANTWTGIATFGKEQLGWLRQFLPFENGTPSHDTLGDLFAIICPEEFNKCFVKWIQSISKITGQIIAVDGKRLRGSYDKADKKSAIHMVSAFASEQGVCLGQMATDRKSNEITAIPKLLDLLAMKGCTVTIDAMGCQKKIAKKIIDKEADYILAVRENQKELLEQIQKVFRITETKSISTKYDTGHGRVETRKCSVIDDLCFLDINKKQWKGLNSIVKVESECYIKVSGKAYKECRYYISSSSKGADWFSDAVRKHWAIENNLHWVLDVVFKEDESRRRSGNSANNFNIINKIAMALIKQNKGKDSIAQTRYRATLSSDFREKLIY
ncbi:MAG: ISAs1 family transposase [Cyclobacteriaceae bacterium]|nr:ISAs1 family transposase [Cyclobacteriaceae bacterium]